MPPVDGRHRREEKKDRKFLERKTLDNHNHDQRKPPVKIMKKSLRAALLASFVLMTAFLEACSSFPGGTGDCCHQALYDGKGMQPYPDTAHGFRICIPRHLTRSGPAGFSDGRVVFSGFVVPPGTTLQSKSLLIVPGSDADVQGAVPFGHFTAGGVTFQRTKLNDGSAGHTTLHITYLWTAAGGQQVYFDFTHYAVNPLVFDPGNRPANYNQSEQIKLTEEIMRTFTPLP